MHQIRFLLGLRPRPCWRSSQRSPRPPCCISGVLLLRKRRENRRKQRKGKEKKNKRGERGREKEGKRRGPQYTFLATPLRKKGGRATKREKTKKTKKINGRREEGRASELGEGDLLALREGWTPLSILIFLLRLMHNF